MTKNLAFTLNAGVCRTVATQIELHGKLVEPQLADINEDTAIALANAIALGVALQHRFWAADEKGHLARYTYTLPSGEEVKPSGYWWDCIYALLEKHPEEFLPTKWGLGTRRWLLTKLLDAEAVNYIPDFEDRAVIVQDFARKVLRKEGGVRQLWLSSESLAAFFAALDKTKGYYDPEHHKKANLLVKMMEQDGLWIVAGKQRKELAPPLDYHLINIAVKTGMVEVHDPETRRRLVKRELLNEDEAAALRAACREAYALVTKDVEPWLVDDVLWNLSRTLCSERIPSCAGCILERFCECHLQGTTLNQSFPFILTDAF